MAAAATATAAAAAPLRAHHQQQQLRRQGAAADVDAAEAALHGARWLQARAAACEALAGGDATPQELTRALFVLLQVDFQAGRLTDLQEASSRPLSALPVSVLLLWGVAALQLDAGAEARSVLSRYCGGADAAGLGPEDALALSRLYGVRVLGEACGEAAAARAWLLSGGTGLTETQQQLLLAELSGVEAAGAGQRSAAAAGPASSSDAAVGGAAGCRGATPDVACSRGADAHRAAGAKPRGGGGGGGDNGGAAAAPTSAAGLISSGGVGGAAQPQSSAFSPFVTFTGEIEELPEDSFGGAAAHLAHTAGSWQQEPAQPEQQTANVWARACEAAARCWESETVQGALEAAGLRDAAPWQLASGAAAAALVAYAVYRERRGVRRGAAALLGGAASGLAQLAGMATGVRPDAMAAAPRAVR
ncbi:hypothetical protein Rsub_00714 [Raphidocelis subcapitata]|uniref:Uncharacterized protein n=1 Tax=Raphidocelis subcapitata TaxID=307507 RepID=A0A2V0NNE4_9CHLO|nr:hypothetical protein Rsub_00714 [Raphidocelis subcapitata]|eukprot:GBF88002.1 hypothetical protein Rsub_00714 [Raphidocelis subcapitata]